MSLSLDIMREQTTFFIAEDPVVLVLQREERVSLDSGGFSRASRPVDPQTFRLIPANDRLDPIQDQDGQSVQPVFTILGEWNADMARFDRFSYAGHEYQILTPIRPLHTDNAYERKAEVVFYG